MTAPDTDWIIWPPFDSWLPEVVRDYCDYALLPEGDRWVLACPPAVEAEIYAASNLPDADLRPMLGRVEAPVTVVRGGIPWKMDRFDLAASPTDPQLAAAFGKGEDVVLEGRSHYIPMETPEIVAERIWPRIHTKLLE